MHSQSADCIQWIFVRHFTHIKCCRIDAMFLVTQFYCGGNSSGALTSKCSRRFSMYAAWKLFLALNTDCTLSAKENKAFETIIHVGEWKCYTRVVHHLFIVSDILTYRHWLARTKQYCGTNNHLLKVTQQKFVWRLSLRPCNWSVSLSYKYIRQFRNSSKG